MPEIRLTGVDGTQIGIVRTSEALAMAEEAGVDLVEVAAKANPPVCRLMDYGKFRYQEQKRQQEIKAKQKVIQVKEVKFRPATDENDYQTKLRALTRFLGDGNKAKVTLRYRGREMAHQDLGQDVLTRIREDLAEIAQVEQFPKLRIPGRTEIENVDASVENEFQHPPFRDGLQRLFCCFCLFCIGNLCRGFFFRNINSFFCI